MSNGLLNGATGEVTSPRPLAKKTKKTLLWGLPVRDVSQSEMDNDLAMDDSEVLEMQELIGELNKAGSGVKVDAFEGDSGAQPQVNYYRGRCTLASLQTTHETLPTNITNRLLVRGEFGVCLEPRTPEDLEETYRLMANAAGATSGRTVTFKVFDAQNRPEKIAASINALRKLRGEGFAIEAEIAMCYSAYDGLGRDYYQDRMKKLLAVDSGDGLVTAFSLKDTVGYLRGVDVPFERGNTAELTRMALQVMDAHKAQNLASGLKTFAIHSHDSGHADEAMAAGMAAYLQEPTRHEFNMRGDGIFGGHGFPDPVRVNEKLRKADALAAAIAPAQHDVIKKMESCFTKIFARYGDDLKPLWTGDQLVRSRIAKGAQRSAMRLGIKPLLDHNPEFDFRAPRAGAGIDHLRHVVLGVFGLVNGQLAEQYGLTHAVTLAANNHNMSAMQVVGAMMKDGFLKDMLTSGKDPWVMPDSEWAGITERYHEAITHTASMHYFAGPMPGKKHPGLAAQIEKMNGENDPPQTVGLKLAARNYALDTKAKYEKDKAPPEHRLSQEEIRFNYLIASRGGVAPGELAVFCKSPAHVKPVAWFGYLINHFKPTALEQKIMDAYMDSGAKTFDELRRKIGQRANDLRMEWVLSPSHRRHGFGMAEISRRDRDLALRFRGERLPRAAKG